VKFGDSSQIEPGDWVMAIGNPFNLSHTVSVGVISAMKRPFPVSTGRSLDMLQTDAAINPGNSGGPLLNIRGEVVGMNTAIYSDARQSGNIGIGFAVPINVVRSLLPQLRGGKITRGMIGVQVQPVPRDSYADLGPEGAPRRAGRQRQRRQPGPGGRHEARRCDSRRQRQAGFVSRRARANDHGAQAGDDGSGEGDTR
jgi:S1-C subfamily serine protease